MTTPARPPDSDTPTIPSGPNPAAIYDYWLGGRDNTLNDRIIAEQIMAIDPGIAAAARASRAFLGRAVKLLAERGVRQFLDIGCGLPTADNTHQVAQRVEPKARVAYVDNNPVVVAHGNALLRDGQHVRVVQGDLLQVEEILSNPAVHEVIDFGRPVAVLLVAVLHFVPDPQAQQIVAAIRNKTCPGSYLVISHAEHVDPKIVERYKPSGLAVPRPREEVTGFFDGYDLLGPGVVAVESWDPFAKQVDDDPSAIAVCGVGRKQ